MSHVVAVDLKIPVDQLDLVEAALADLGAMLARNVKHYAWYGRLVGDYNDERFASMRRAGVKPGECEHVIRLRDHKQGEYEIGLVKTADGKYYEAVGDFWGPGQRIFNALGGPSLSKLKDHVGAEIAMRHAARRGQRARKTIEQDGSVIVDVLVEEN